MYAQADRLEYVRMLLEAGCEVNHRDAANHNSMLNLLVKLKRLGDKVVRGFALIRPPARRNLRTGGEAGGEDSGLPTPSYSNPLNSGTHWPNLSKF